MGVRREPEALSVSAWTDEVREQDEAMAPGPEQDALLKKMAQFVHSILNHPTSAFGPIANEIVVHSCQPNRFRIARAYTPNDSLKIATSKS